METLLHKSGYISQERQREIDAAKGRQAVFAREQQAAALVRASGVWPRYTQANLDDLTFPQRMLTAVEFGRYVAVRDQLRTLGEAPGILVLHGSNGPGKTHLASALVLEFCRRGVPARFVTANDFFLKLKSTFGERGRTQEELIQQFRAYELLVIDEIEVRSDSNWENQQLRDLINARYSSLLSTVILTNKTADEIEGQNGTPYFSTAIRDRIRHEGAMLACDWPSLRQRAYL